MPLAADRDARTCFMKFMGKETENKSDFWQTNNVAGFIFCGMSALVNAHKGKNSTSPKVMNIPSSLSFSRVSA